MDQDWIALIKEAKQQHDLTSRQVREILEELKGKDKMKIEQKDYHTTFYIEVESHYHNISDAKFKSDAIMITMGQKAGKAHEIDALVTCSTESARNFAKSILKLCEEIEES